MTDNKVDFPVVPTVEVSSADDTAVEGTSLEVIHTKATQAMMISTEVATADISAPLGNDHKSVAINFLYVVINPRAFVEILVLSTPITGPS